jgi:hypothetical protein
LNKDTKMTYFACTDISACPVPFHVYVEIPHMTRPHPCMPRLYASLATPPLALAPFPHMCTFLAEDDNQYVTLRCLIPIYGLHFSAEPSQAKTG